MNETANLQQETFAREVLGLEGICKSYARGLFGRKKTSVLKDVRINIEPGSLTGLFGPSGAGKTTLGDIALGLRRQDCGRVRWLGRDVQSMSREDKKALRPRFQKLFQDPALSFAPFLRLKRSLDDAVRFLSSGSKSGAELKKSMDTLMREMKLGRELLERTPDSLSGGEIQRFALIRCLLADPVFLVADEPTSRLDPLVQAQVARLIQQTAVQKNLSVLFISHDLDLLQAVCTRIIALENGKIRQLMPKE